MMAIPWEEEGGRDSEKSNGEIPESSRHVFWQWRLPSRPSKKPIPVHPAFKLLDARGEVIKQEGKGPRMGFRTCGQCHSAAFVSEHNLPAHQQRKIACLSCHYEGRRGKLELRGFRVGTRHDKAQIDQDEQALPYLIAAVATG